VQANGDRDVAALICNLQIDIAVDLSAILAMLVRKS
jgi:hypothetical protein